jgi:hypothetical protein
LLGLAAQWPVVDVGLEYLPARLQLGDDRLSGRVTVPYWVGPEDTTAIEEPIAFRNAARDEVMLP